MPRRFTLICPQLSQDRVLVCKFKIPMQDGTNFSTTTHLSCLPQHPELGSYSKFAQVWHFTWAACFPAEVRENACFQNRSPPKEPPWICQTKTKTITTGTTLRSPILHPVLCYPLCSLVSWLPVDLSLSQPSSLPALSLSLIHVPLTATQCPSPHCQRRTHHACH